MKEVDAVKENPTMIGTVGIIGHDQARQICKRLATKIFNKKDLEKTVAKELRLESDQVLVESIKKGKSHRLKVVLGTGPGDIIFCHLPGGKKNHNSPGLFTAQ